MRTKKVKTRSFFMLLGFLLAIIACNRERNNVDEVERETFKDSLKNGRLKKDEMKRDKELDNNFPYGAHELIDIKFPKRWVHTVLDGAPDTNKRSEEMSGAFDTLKEDFKIKEEKSSKLNEKSSEQKVYTYNERKEYVQSYDNLSHSFSKEHTNEIFYKVVKEFDKEGLEKVVLFAGVTHKSDDDSEDHDHSHYHYERQDLVTFDLNGNEKDGFVFAYSVQYSHYLNYSRHSYIDKNFIVHSKDFLTDEEYTDLIRYEKWQINEQGLFIRYFDQYRGEFKSDEESGKVMNHTKIGKWTEFRPSGFVNRRFGHKVLAEGNYRDGIKVGTWNYYEPHYDFDSNLVRIQGSRRNGELIYSEVYKNGVPVRRSFKDQSN